MTSAYTKFILWIVPEDSSPSPDAALQRRAGIEDPCVEVRTERLSGWAHATIPAGSRDEWGDLVLGAMNIAANQLPPKGRIFVVAEDADNAAE